MGWCDFQHSEKFWTDVWLSQCPNIPPKMLSIPPQSMNLLQVHSWCLLVL